MNGKWAVMYDPCLLYTSLSFIKMRTVKRDDIDAEGNPVARDYIIFYDVEKYFRPDLGTEPKGLMEHIGAVSYTHLPGFGGMLLRLS